MVISAALSLCFDRFLGLCDWRVVKAGDIYILLHRRTMLDMADLFVCSAMFQTWGCVTVISSNLTSCFFIIHINRFS